MQVYGLLKVSISYYEKKNLPTKNVIIIIKID